MDTHNSFGLVLSAAIALSAENRYEGFYDLKGIYPPCSSRFCQTYSERKVAGGEWQSCAIGVSRIALLLE